MEPSSQAVLASPTTDELWAAYHDIRRTILFEGRDRFGVYDANHADELKPNHFPKLLLLDGEPIGVIRIDIDNEAARFRLVAIVEPRQRQGHGRKLLALAEEFAREQGAETAMIASAPDAVAFYQRLGYALADETDQPDSVGMVKRLDKA